MSSEYILWRITLFSVMFLTIYMGGGPRVAVNTAAFHAETGFVPWSRRFERNKKYFFPIHKYCGEPTWPRGTVHGPQTPQGSNFESCVWRAVSSHSSYHPHEVLLTQFNLYVLTGGLKSHSFHVHFLTIFRREIEILDNTRHFVTDINRLRPTKACLGAGVRFRA